MTNWLFEQTIIMSCIIIILLVGRPIILRTLGAQAHYLMWLLIPASLLMGALPSVQNYNNQIMQYIVEVKQVGILLNASLIDLPVLVMAIWAAVSLILITLLYRHHSQYIAHLQLTPLSDGNSKSAVFKSAVIKSAVIKSGNIEFFQSKHCKSPFVTGFFQPILVLPNDFNQTFSPLQQSLIVQHEMTHLTRSDHRWNALAHCVLIVFWFNPLSWLAYKHFRQSQELACDQAVVAALKKSERLAYAKAMLACTVQGAKINLTLLNYGEKELMNERLKQLKTHRPTGFFKSMMMILVLLPAVVFINLVDAKHPTENGQHAGPVTIVEPEYPTDAAAKGIEGYVQLEFTINTDGSVSDVTVLEAQPEGIFNRSAKKAFRQWHYVPTGSERTGMKIQLDFKLDNS
jgi:TonB family protein